MKKRLTGIFTALAAALSLSVLVNADNAGVYNNKETAQSLKEFLITGSNTGTDINHDNQINILDLAHFKAAALDVNVTKGLFSLKDIPAYSGTACTEVNNNVPFFKFYNYTECFEYYSELDELGRCGTTIALIGKETMPAEERGEIGSVKPTGWHTYKYDCIPDIYLYNRCHLIGFQLSGENANVKNLITGTRYMNVTGMEPFESKVASYIKTSGNHVIYRVTPIFEDENLVAHGVLMEAYSLEDNGKGIQFNVFCYNVQPDIEIDYATGESRYVGEEITNPASTTFSETVKSTTAPVTTPVPPAETNLPVTDVPANEPVVTDPTIPSSQTYVLNTYRKKFHYPDCASVEQMNEKNRQYVDANRDDLIAQGYSPCGNCKP